MLSTRVRALVVCPAMAWAVAACNGGGAEGQPLAEGGESGEGGYSIDGGSADGASIDATATDSGDGRSFGRSAVQGPNLPAEGDDGGQADSEAGCGFDAGTAPDGSPVCGDGWRDPATEECDDGLGTSTARRGCTATCQVIDELAVEQWTPDGGLSNAPRTLGAGRHPLAAGDATFGVVYLEPNSSPLTLSLATFGARGAATGVVNAFSAYSTVVDNSNPVVAALPCGQYAVAWADYDSEGGDELDVAVRIVDPSVPVTTPPAHANTSTNFSQFDPDILWTGSELVVAWVDDSDPATQPDLKFRTFDANLNPTSGEQTLAATADSEADVALAAWEGSWAAAWRDDANGTETITVQAGSSTWTVGPAFLPGPEGAKPALAELDATHLLVVYAVGADNTDSGVANDSLLEAAVVDTAAAPGPVAGFPVPALVANAQGLDQSAPTLVNVQGSVFLAWSTAGALGNANGEDLWLKPLPWDGSSVDLTKTEVPLPRWPQAIAGDQESPALAASALPPGGALVTAWNDLGRGILPGEGGGDVAVELVPVPMLRTGAVSCAPGWADCDSNPEDGCEVSTTQPAHCGSCTTTCSAGGACVESGGTYSCLTCSGGTPLACGSTCVDPTGNPNDCGGCGNVCTTTVANAQPTCALSACSYACSAGFSACSGACLNEATNVDNCGGCGQVCSPPANATATCASGACGFTCNTPLSDCSGTCVNETDNPSNCGSCGSACSAPVNATADCVASSCGFTCNAGFSDCSGSCVNEANDLNNCGTCGHVCLPPANATATCLASVCGFSCDAGFLGCPATNPTSCIPEPVTGAAFVTPGGAGNCSATNPCGTIAAALAASSTVYLNAGTYTEQVSLASGHVIHGGWTYSGGTWTNCEGTNTTSIIQAPSGDDRVVIASGGTLDTLTVRNANTASAGQTLYGVFASSGNVTLTNVAISVAAGGAGTIGAAGTEGSNGSTAGCSPASTGSAGPTGTVGTAGSTSYASSGFVSTAGTAGGAAGTGSDGTAGSESGLSELQCALNTCAPSHVTHYTTAGSPGCPGTGGTGGQAGGDGGASIALFVYGATVQVTGGSWSTAGGGTGGAGGGGGAGGAGEPGVAGSTITGATSGTCAKVGSSCLIANPVEGSATGIAGGRGGNGGTGGQGGGGAGGDSWCYASGGGGSVNASGLSCSEGAAGSGGGSNGPAGAAGVGHSF